MDKIFIIEDDYNYSQALSNYLDCQGFSCLNASDVTDIKQIEHVITSEQPQLIIMDYYFEGMTTSVNLMSYIKKYQIPLIYLTSNQNASDELKLYQLGISDFISKEKPFAIISEKIKLLLHNNLDYQFFGNTLNVETKKINEQIKLTDNEYRILLLLIKSIPNYVSSEELMVELWNESIFIEKNTLFVAIKRLREKLDKYELNVVIKSQKNLGYTIDER